MRELAIGEAPVERGDDRAELRAGKLDFDVLCAVAREQRDALAAAQAACGEGMRETVGARIERAV